MSTILIHYNSLSDKDRKDKQLWKKLRFGNGPVYDVAKIRGKILTYTAAISMSLHLLALGSQGRVERYLTDQASDLKDIGESINLLVAKANAQSPDGSVMTNYANDEIAFWWNLWRELVNDGYPSKAIQGQKKLIQDYIRELGSRGVLDDRAGKYWTPAEILHHVEQGPSANCNIPGQFLAQEEATRETNISAETPQFSSVYSPFSAQGRQQQQQQQQQYYQCPNVSSKECQVQTTSEGDAEYRTANSEDRHDTFDQATQHEQEANEATRLFFLDSETFSTQEPIQIKSNQPEGQHITPEITKMLERISYLEELNHQQEQLLQTAFSRKEANKSEDSTEASKIRFKDAVGRKVFVSIWNSKTLDGREV
jgi:hypothetical protein